MPLPLQPDPVALAIQAYRGQASITALVVQRIYDRIPGSPSWPLIVVGLVSQAPLTEPGWVTALLQLDVWGNGPGPADAAAALTVARTVWAATPDLHGNWPGFGAVAQAYPSLLLPQPDTTTGRARYIVQTELTCAPEA